MQAMEEDADQQRSFRFKDLVDQIPALIYVDVIDGNVLYVSPYIEQMLGITPEEWIAHEGDPWEAHLHPDDKERALAQLEEYADGGADLDPYRLVGENGNVVWVQDIATLHRDAEGRQIEQGVMVDITETKRAEETLAFQAQLLESISDAVIAYDTEMVVTSWNRAARSLYGWEAEEVVGQPLPAELRYDVEDLVTAGLADPFMQEMDGWVGRVVQRDRDGFEIQIETKGMPLRASDGSLRGYVMVNREISNL